MKKLTNEDRLRLRDELLIEMIFEQAGYNKMPGQDKDRAKEKAAIIRRANARVAEIFDGFADKVEEDIREVSRDIN